MAVDNILGCVLWALLFIHYDTPTRWRSWVHAAHKHTDSRPVRTEGDDAWLQMASPPANPGRSHRQITHSTAALLNLVLKFLMKVFRECEPFKRGAWTPCLLFPTTTFLPFTTACGQWMGFPVPDPDSSGFTAWGQWTGFTGLGQTQVRFRKSHQGLLRSLNRTIDCPKGLTSCDWAGEQRTTG